MDTFLMRLDRLAEMARSEAGPVPLDAAGVMSRIRGLDIEREPEPLPLAFFAGGMVAAAAAAAIIAHLAFPAWSDLSSPLNLLSSLPEGLDAFI